MTTSRGMRVCAMAFAFAFMAGILALTLGAGTAWAATDGPGDGIIEEMPKNQTYKVLYHPHHKSSNVYEFIQVNTHKKLKNLKSSNKKVVSVKRMANGTEFRATVKKAGKATVSFKFKGKKYKIRFVVKTYTNPFKTLTIGSNSYKGLFANSLDDYVEGYLAGTVTVKTSKYWTLKRIEVGYSDGYTEIINNGDYIYGDIDCLTFVLKSKRAGYVAYRAMRPIGSE